MTAKRWDRDLRQSVEAPDIDAFLDDVIAVCRKHNMTLDHDDPGGGFLVVRGFDGDDCGLRSADIVGTTP